MGFLPDLDHSTIGDRINVVCELVLAGSDEKHLVRIMGTSTLVIFHGALSPGAFVWTFLDVMVCEGTHRLGLRSDSKTYCYGHSPMSIDSLTCAVELCAGAGFLSTGLQAAGFDVIAGVEQNGRFRMLYDQQNLGEFIHSDIGETRVVQQILAMDGQNSMVASGIACQPYSRAGDCKGGQDSRATTLPKSLEVAWMIQSPIVLLECTPRALQDPFVQSTLDHFCSVGGGYLKTQGLLHLEHSWASYRARWWCILCARPLGEISFPSMPMMPGFQRVDAIMPYIKSWPQPDIDELTLTWDEHRQFQQYSHGVTALALDTTKQMATALHSWGNQCRDCSCGCRGSLSESRLQSRGLFGVLVPSKETLVLHEGTCPVSRHLHPSEVAILCGAFPNLSWEGNCRLGLAATGQMASPLQSCWVGSHIMKHLASLFQQDCPDPAAKFRALIASLLSVRDEMWPSLRSQMVPTRSLPTLVGNLCIRLCFFDTELAITCQPGLKIFHVVNAEVQMHGGLVGDFVVLNESGETIDFECSLMHDMKLWLLPKHVYVLRQIDPVELPGFSEDEVACLRTGKGLDFPLDSKGPLPVHQANVHAVPSGFPPAPGASSHKNDLEAVSVFPGNMCPEIDDPLCKVGKKGFLCMPCPRILDVDALADFRNQTMNKSSRAHTLANQGLMWADDELLFQLYAMASNASPEQHVHVWDPLLTTSVCKYGIDSWIASLDQSLPGVITIISVIAVSHHWIPVVWRKEEHSLLAYIANATEQQTEVLRKLHQSLCIAWKVPITDIRSRKIPPSLPFDQGCGLIAIEFIDHLLRGSEPVFERDSLLAKHAIYRQAFVESMPECVARPWIWGNGFNDPKNALLAILRQHGIEDSELTSRYEMLCSKLGKDKVEAAAGCPNPWKQLKWLANQSVPPVQIVMPAELQKAIDHRSKSAAPIGRKKKNDKGKGKGKGKGPPAPPVDPSLLRLEEGIFVANESKLSQLPLGSIGPMANGVVLASYLDALPYLQTGKPISSLGLGLIVVDMPKDCKQLPVASTMVTFPVVCAANSEPMLLEGALFQLGVSEITKAIRDAVVELKSIDTCVVKCVIFRDQITGAWSDVTSHPMKYLLQCIPLLVCCQKGCCDEKCGNWHVSAETNLRDPLLEVWNRQWMSMSYAFANPSDAEMFAVSVRLPKQLEPIQMFSGQHGVYLEPKSIDGRSVSPDFHIVWVPKASLAQAVIYKQTIPGILGLARVGAKLGLRCWKNASESVHMAVKPDIQYLPSGAKQTYMVGPIPWGTLKQSLNAALQQLGWEAKVLQAVPAGRDFQGVLWRVHALSPPPTTVLHLSSGEAVITRVDHPAIASSNGGNAVLGSNASVNFVRKGSELSDRGVDRIFLEDPWASYKAPIAPPVHVPDALASLEQKVVSSVMAKLPREAMEIDTEQGVDRVGALEAKVQELHEQHTRMQSVIQEQGHTQQAQMVQMQSQFQAQHQRLEKVVGEQSTKLSSLTSQFSQQLEKQQSHIDGMFQCQMQRIEDLLSKKARHE